MLPHDELLHYGVRGMRWGIRGAKLEGVSNKTFKEAGRDAEEFTRAKMFYGDTAGTRRKLIKATVEAKSKKDPSYKKAFDHHIEKTDFAKRASQARGERKRKDAKAEVRKTARGIKNLVGMSGIGMTAALMYGGYKAWKNPQVRAAVTKVAGQTMTYANQVAGAAKLHSMGL